MFDVPVPEVTVSSVPAFIEGIGQTTQTTARTPQVASALLNALPVLTQISPASPQAAVKTEEGDTAQTLIPKNSFQLLEPLNLADTAKALEQAFAGSLDDLPSQSIGDNQRPMSESIATVQSPKLDSADTNFQPSVPASQPSSGGIDVDKLSPAFVPRKELHQCTDLSYEADYQGITALQVWLRGTQIGEVGTDEVVPALQEILVDEPFNPDDITPVLETDQPAIYLSEDITLRISASQDTQSSGDAQSKLSQTWATIVWSDQIRQKLGAKPLDAGDIQIKLKGLTPSDQQLDGIASWYGPYFHGRLTANGETFDQNTLTAAHKSLPFNTILQVRNLNNNHTVVVRINDRGPYIGKRSLDLSKAAAQCLGSEQVGIIPYEATILEPALADSPTQ